ncbi:hypothetical protein INH39_01250 [Massilia violaceinigra]|uniref:Uncharacterized protein n=1 Tax=Massilia violaceinigra TaxID=2045208 RepID=A0ABY4A6Z3_9BURK|nr:hypothetical protein [Massilia violaceinigra]UOD30417.1 hypothetical protein INH39_01250 [Massilia violaceinigra]
MANLRPLEARGIQLRKAPAGRIHAQPLDRLDETLAYQIGPDALPVLGMNLSSGRFAELDTSRFKRPLVVPPLKARQLGKATGSWTWFCRSP